jgi:hypothetical protein
MGTGNTVFFQLGYLLSKNFLGKEASQTRFQPNIAIQYSDFEGGMKLWFFDLGVNLFFKGMPIN